MDMINEHDMTRKMINTMNDSRKIVKEEELGGRNEMGGVEDEQDEQDDSDVIELPQDERKTYEKQFKDIVDDSAVFDVFNVYPKSRNVVFGGTVQGMGGIEFQLTLEDNDGVYITGNNIQITSEFPEKIKRLYEFYKQFRSDWFSILDTDYKDRT